MKFMGMKKGIRGDDGLSEAMRARGDPQGKSSDPASLSSAVLLPNPANNPSPPCRWGLPEAPAGGQASP